MIINQEAVPLAHSVFEIAEVSNLNGGIKLLCPRQVEACHTIFNFTL